VFRRTSFDYPHREGRFNRRRPRLAAKTALGSIVSEYRQIVWDDACRDACRALVQMAMREDLDGGDLSADITTDALVPADTLGHAVVAARKPGVIAGLPCVPIVLSEYDPRLQWEPLVADGDFVSLGQSSRHALRVVDGTRSVPATMSGQAIGRVSGPARSLLAAERTLLNILGRLSGVATLTRRYVERVAGTRARIYDTRKTTPGWRLLEKYAVRLGGGHNHRLNLAEGVLIKDNHLSVGAEAGRSRHTPCAVHDTRSGPTAASGQQRDAHFSPAEAVRRARAYLAAQRVAASRGREDPLVEVEIDRLDQLDDVLAAGPDIVLLDNMTPGDLRQAVARRDRLAPAIELEASGGIDLASVAAIVAAGVDRISVGALTHSATWFDVGLDWPTG
jgi:nicotinate-nucleotide pyrophosphorylase (carboxylating)